MSGWAMKAGAVEFSSKPSRSRDMLDAVTAAHRARPRNCRTERRREEDLPCPIRDADGARTRGEGYVTDGLINKRWPASSALAK